MDDLRIAVEQKFIFLMVHVFTFAAIVFTIGKYLLTPVSGIILLSVAKLITGDKTLIITTLATQKTRRVLRFRYNLDTSAPVSISRALTMASLRMVPPCTTIFLPKVDISFSFNTL